MQRADIEELFYGKPEQQRRFTQDFPILPDVWIAFGEKPLSRLELLLTPHSRTDAATLGRAVRARLQDETQATGADGQSLWSTDPSPQEPRRILFNEAVVLARFSFWELMRVALPLTDWWARTVASPGLSWDRENILDFAARMKEHKPGADKPARVDPRMIRKLISVAGLIELERKEQPHTASLDADNPSGEQIEAFADLMQSLTSPHERRGLVWSICCNRPADTSVWRSRVAIKADAAARLFDIKTTGIRWAVLDTGIDARHKAFMRQAKESDAPPDLDERGENQFPSRVVRTYDFLRLKELLDPDTPTPTANSAVETMPPGKLHELRSDLEHNLSRGKPVDWELLEPFLRVPHNNSYVRPTDSHGTHVAGIIAADWPDAAKDTALCGPLQGICPDMELYDLRVLGKGADEFTIIAALQFVRYLNAHKDLMLIHGVNLSMSVQHDVANYACGRTPVCEECERVVASGMVVVTAAGNRGFNKLAHADRGSLGDYRYISITDPGNADSVITVGSTHRFMPHTYGVSYFSSRGPTGDGRTKPDIVAPGERIDSCSLNGDFETMDGTSMAAPHVSGAAALLLARYRELIGQPKRVKEILVKSATDLGREPRFQGAGMLDVLRALQSV